MGRIMIAVRAVFVVAVLAVSAVWWAGCDGGDNPGDNGGGGNNTGGNNTGGNNTGGNNTGGSGSDGQYEYVTLGGKKWMKKNLNVSTSDSWCYDNNSSNCNTYGRLYTWSAAKSACQSVGWRLPDTADWRRLVEAAGGSSAALKSTSGWYQNIGTDAYGFSALPAGSRSTTGSFSDAGDIGYWWTATETGYGEAFYRDMYYFYGVMDERVCDVGIGFSVRCVKDL